MLKAMMVQKQSKRGQMKNRSVPIDNLKEKVKT